MKFKKWEEEMCFRLKKILSLKMLERLVKCINAYKIIQNNDFDET